LFESGFLPVNPTNNKKGGEKWCQVAVGQEKCSQPSGNLQHGCSSSRRLSLHVECQRALVSNPSRWSLIHSNLEFPFRFPSGIGEYHDLRWNS
jgi:hypothetical protein